MEKNSLMMLTEKGYVLKQIPYIYGHRWIQGGKQTASNNRKVHRYRRQDIGAKIWAEWDTWGTPHIKYSNPLHEVASLTESIQGTHSPLPRLLLEQFWSPAPAPPTLVLFFSIITLYYCFHLCALKFRWEDCDWWKPHSSVKQTLS